MQRQILIRLLGMLLYSYAALYAQGKKEFSSPFSTDRSFNQFFPSFLMLNTKIPFEKVPTGLALSTINRLAAMVSLSGESGAQEQTSGKSTITGRVVDAATGEPLPGANVLLEGTAIGTMTNLDGKYQINRVPLGNYVLKVTYIGYKAATTKVSVLSSKAVTVDMKLVYDVLEGEMVVITAQAEGQVAAINQQLSSNTIKNIVSAERILELPDANAAESVGRLPGISIQRSGGEGTRVVIRGLSPTYNTIMIGGIKVPATDLDDRSVDLSMISPEILAGIEVTKALTPDMDADAFGGTVNFTLADAPTGGFRYNMRFQEGYNQQRNQFGQYKGSATLSNRYLDEKFGIMITGNIEQAQRGSDQFSAGYTILREKREGEEFAPMSVGSVNLDYVNRIRKRTGFSVLTDFRLPHGKITFTNYFSRLDAKAVTDKDRYSEDSNRHTWVYGKSNSQIDIITNSFSGEHSLYFGTINWQLSRTESNTRNPYVHQIEFQDRAAFDQTKLTDPITPEALMAAANPNLNNMGMYYGDFSTEKALERDYNAQLNIDLPYVLARKIAGHFKLGGKYVSKSKERDRFGANDRLDNFNPIVERWHSRYGAPDFVYQRIPATAQPSLLNYLDPGFDSGNFLNGAYQFRGGLDHQELDRLIDGYLIDSTYAFSSIPNIDDYETTESIAAAYMLTEINFGRFFMLLPGVRYEYTANDMTGRKGSVARGFFEPDLDQPNVSDTTATASYRNWFPMIHARLRPAGWFDIRFAYTQSISRPRLDMMLPKKKVIADAQTVEFGRPDLKPQISENYDLFLSFYGNQIGLFTAGGFYKKIQDLIFERSGHKILNAQKEGYPKELQGFWLDQPENNIDPTIVKGFELEWQTRLVWLPAPFDGIVLNVNYSHIWSETRFPRSFVRQEKLKVFPFIKTTVIDSFRVGKMPNQTDDIANLAIGYDKGPISARLSMLFQGRMLRGVGERPENDRFTADLLRWDLSVKYRLTKGMGLFLNFNNISNEPDEAYRLAKRFLTDREYYGWTSDIGIGYNF